MDEKGFKQYLEIKFENEDTRRQYFERTKQFENWLETGNDKHIENADECDLNRWAHYVLKELSSYWTLYLHSIKQYYLFTHAPQAEILKKIIKEMPSTTKRKHISMLWTDWERSISKAKEKHIEPKHYALLNLLWSEMESSDILNLYISDVDFESRLITVGDKQYQATERAWDALEELVVPENRGKKERLFNITSPRRLQQIVDGNLGEWGLKPKNIWQSCRDALPIAGRTVIFETTKPYAQISTSPQKPTDLNNKKSKKLFDRLVEEISNFGGRLRTRIVTIKNEKELQRLLEGYLLAAFPDEKIFPEFPFKGHKPKSTIDFVIGEEEKIPIEVKFAETKTMGTHKRDGSGQVIEYLEHRKKDKGIVVIGDKDRDYNNKKENGLLSKVYIMVI